MYMLTIDWRSEQRWPSLLSKDRKQEAAGFCDLPDITRRTSVMQVVELEVS